MKPFKLTLVAAALLVVSAPGYAADLDDDITIRVIERQDRDRDERGVHYLELPDMASQEAREALERVREREHAGDDNERDGHDDGAEEGRDDDRDEARDDDREDARDEDREDSRDEMEDSRDEIQEQSDERDESREEMEESRDQVQEIDDERDELHEQEIDDD